MRVTMRLPLDIDGEPICEHDVVDVRNHAGEWSDGHKVVAICEDGCYVGGLLSGVFHAHASDVRHHNEPTLRDILHELVLKCVTLDGYKKTDGGNVPVVGCDDGMLDEWLDENEGVLVLGDAK